MKITNCLKLIERDKQVIAPCSHLSYFPLAVASARGSLITDEDGNQFAVMCALYLGGIAMAIVAGLFLKHFVFHGDAALLRRQLRSAGVPVAE